MANWYTTLKIHNPFADKEDSDITLTELSDFIEKVIRKLNSIKSKVEDSSYINSDDRDYFTSHLEEMVDNYEYFFEDLKAKDESEDPIERFSSLLSDLYDLGDCYISPKGKPDMKFMWVDLTNKFDK